MPGLVPSSLKVPQCRPRCLLAWVGRVGTFKGTNLPHSLALQGEMQRWKAALGGLALLAAGSPPPEPLLGQRQPGAAWWCGVGW
jgi:hypothetical protein